MTTFFNTSHPSQSVPSVFRDSATHLLPSSFITTCAQKSPPPLQTPTFVKNLLSLATV